MGSIGEYDGFETSRCISHLDDHRWKKIVSSKQKPAANGNLENVDEHRKQKPAANGNLDNDDEEQASDVEDDEIAASQSNGCDDEIAARSENLKPKSDLEIAAAKIDISHLADFLVQKSNERWPDVLKLAGFLDYFGIALSGVPCPWPDMFKDSDSIFDVFHVPLSQIPQPVYKTSVDWITKHLTATVLRGFVMWTFHYILDDMSKGPNGWKKGEEPTEKSRVAIFVAIAMILRSTPRALTMVLPYLKKDPKFQGKGMIPVRIWMIAQASQDDFCVGLYSWARNLLPVAGGSNPQSRHLILKFVEKILLETEARTRLVNAPVWMGSRLIPTPSFEILLRLTFPASSARVKATSRFEAIYPSLKEVALAGAPKTEDMKQIFTLCLRLAGEEGNPDLAKEAMSIAIWSLTENVACWKHWEDIYKENLKASVVLLKKLVEKCEDPSSLKLSSSSPSDTLAGATKSEAMKQVTQQIFTLCLRLAGEGNPGVVKEATSIAIWSLTENVDCWKHWDNLYKENLKAGVVLLPNLVKKWKDRSLKLAGKPGSKAMKQFTQQLFTFSLRLAGEGNPVLPKQATAVAIWSLSEIVDCCKRWDSLYTKNLEASVALLKKMVDKWKEYSLKLKLSSSPSDTLSGAPPSSKAMKQVTEQIFAFSLKLAKEGNSVLAKEATEIAIWSLTENVDCWKRWANLYTKNLEASVTLLKKLAKEWKKHSLKLSSSPSDTLTLTQTMKIFRLKNKKGITEGGKANGSLYKEADKSCKVILGRLSRGSSSILKSAFVTASVLVAAGAATALALSSNLEAATELQNLVESLDLHLYANAIIKAFSY